MHTRNKKAGQKHDHKVMTTTHDEDHETTELSE